eukprot:5351366-Pleurochrysis_carterae.AAC.1
MASISNHIDRRTSCSSWPCWDRLGTFENRMVSVACCRSLAVIWLCASLSMQNGFTKSAESNSGVWEGRTSRAHI